MNTINLCPKLTDRNGYEKPIKRVNVLWDRLNVLKCCQHEIICTTNSIKTIPKPKKEKEQEGKEKKIALRRNRSFAWLLSSKFNTNRMKGGNSGE